MIFAESFVEPVKDSLMIKRPGESLAVAAATFGQREINECLGALERIEQQAGALSSRIAFGGGEQGGTGYILGDRADFESRDVFGKIIEAGFPVNPEEALDQTPA